MHTDTYIDQNFSALVKRLQEWLAIPSVSSVAAHAEDVQAAAEWIRTMMQGAGFPHSEIIATTGHPLVYGEWTVDSSLPTLLLYGHYDVQPVDPLDKWQTPPFSPTIRNNKVFSRGASDDKGQVFLALAAIEAWAKTTGRPPVNLKVLLEGEEEAGGEAIADYVREHPDRLATDAVLICDTAMLNPQTPSLITGLRGILYTELRVDGSITDLHSGSYGGVAPNPLHAICLVIQRLKDEDGRIMIPELKAAIPPASEAEKRFWQQDPLNLAEELKREMGVEQLVGESHIPPLERLGHRPTLEIHGIAGGYTGEGAKTVIPATATAKISMRLPGSLDPEQVFNWLHKSVTEKMPAGYRFTLTNLHAGGGVLVDPDSIPVRAAAQVLQNYYPHDLVYMREGGSIPIAALFSEILEVPLVLMGFGLPDDAIHAPNEHFDLDQLRLGMKCVASFLEEFKTLSERRE